MKTYSSILKTKNFWSRGIIARLYRKHAGKYFKKIHNFVLEKFLTNDVKSVLDVACGPGDFLLYIKNKNSNLEIFGTDIAPGMIEYAKIQLGEKANLIVADSENQPFTDESFDLITTMMAFHHFQDKLKVLKEVQRVLKPKGRYIICDIIAKSSFQKRFWNLLERITGIRGPVAHYTERDLKTLSNEAGFSEFTCELIPGMPKRYKVCSLRK